MANMGAFGVPAALTISATVEFIVADFKRRQGMPSEQVPLVILCVDEIFKQSDVVLRSAIVSDIARLQDGDFGRSIATVVPIMTSLAQFTMSQELLTGSNRNIQVSLITATFFV